MLRTVAHLALALALVVTPTGLAGRMLCVGANGHHEIEISNADCCGPGAADDAQTGRARCADGCIDTPIALSAISQKSRPLTPVFFPASAVLGGSGGVFVWHVTWSPSWHSPPPRPPRLFGTTVQRC
jgi:hypothetical protein